jgi:hypothetical protein
MMSITTCVSALLIFSTYSRAIGRPQTSWVTVQSHRKLKPIAGRVSLLKTFSTRRQESTETENEAFSSIFDDIAMNSKNQRDEETELSQYYRIDPDDDPNRPIPDKEGLRDLLFQRFEARRNCAYDTVERIDTELRKTHGVRAFDNPNFWTRQSRPPRSYLRRSVSKTAAKMKTHFGPTGHPYNQVGQGIDQVTCPLTLTEIHSLLSRRCQSRLQGKYEEADAVRFDMELNGLHAHDGLMQWRADGHRRFDESKTLSEEISEPEQPFVEDVNSKNDTETDGKLLTFRRVDHLMKMRAEALARRETIVSDLLSLELYKTYGVIVDDNLRSWSYVVADATDNVRQPVELPDKNVSLCITKDIFPPTMFANEEQRYASPAYRQSENSRNVPNDLARQRIEQLVQERIHKRDERKFLESDAIRRELWQTYHVGISDRLRQWSVAGVLDSDQEYTPHSYYSQKEGSSCLLPDQQEEVENLLRYLESTRKGQNKNVEHPILQRLSGVYRVEVDDDRMEWHVATKDDGIYRPRGELSGVPQKKIEVIQGLVDRRHKELQKGKNQVADTIAEGLWRKHQVIIDDYKHQWKLVPSRGLC